MLRSVTPTPEDAAANSAAAAEGQTLITPSTVEPSTDPRPG